MAVANIPAAAGNKIERQPINLSFRLRMLAFAAVAIVLGLITLLQAVQVYTTSYQLFEGIVQVNSTTVDASEEALQYLASTSQAAADYALLTSDTPLFEQAQNNIFRDYDRFRDQMFTLRANIQTADERAVFTIADTFTENRFWRHVSNLLALRSSDEQSRRQYLQADNHVRNWINPALQELERLNYDQMVAAGERASSTIFNQVIVLAIPALALALLLTFFSLEVRRKVRRYLTPGIDAALILSWVLFLAMLGNLLDVPNQLHTMIQDSYLSVSASARVLVDANLANRAESSALLDLENAAAWDERFTAAMDRVRLRLCGTSDCTSLSFARNSTTPEPNVVSMAQRINADDSARIDGITPLMANITFSGEVTALENARLAMIEYLAVHQSLVDLIDSGSIDEAIALNTGLEEGTSQFAFNKLVEAMQNEQAINRAVFERVWQDQQALLSQSQILHAAGYALVMLLVVVGVLHRYREV